MKRCIMAVALMVLAAPACRTRDHESAKAFAAQTAGTAVSFELTPRAVDSGLVTLELRATTHAGDLSEVDLKQAVRLHVDGKSYAPQEAPSLSGHHDGGSVVFAPSGVPDHFVITISGVRQMEELRFVW